MASVVRFPLVPKARAAPSPRRLSSPIVGREDVIERVVREIDEGARVVTLTGPPGIGKTRTSLACLDRLAPRFPQGAWFCDLSQVTTEEGLAFAVLSQLRFDGARAADEDALARVGEALASCGPIVIVLDNFEQLTFAASAVARWCEEAPELVAVVTSRERLAIDGEITIELKPLDVATAAQLFVKRASDATGDLDDATVAAIVKRLEGIPLAIELAAARTRIMPLAELDRRLAAGQAVLPETLASAIAWSWDLLSNDEKHALARCSVFAGTFTLESAERVAGSVDVMAALRDKSLVHVQANGRLGLYVSIRDFAAKKLAEIGGAADDARHAHARVFAEMSTRFNHWRQMLERADARAHAGIRHEKENIVAAIAWLRSQPLDAELASLFAHLAIAASSLYALPAESSLAALDHAEASLVKAGGDVTVRALLLVARHAVRSNLGEYDEALRDLRDLQKLEGLPRDLALLGRVDEGIALRHHAFPREAWEKHTSARADLERANAPRIFAMNEACMGRLAFDLGDFDASRRFNENAIEAGDRLDDTWLSALAIANLAQLEQELGRFDRAEELLARAIERLRVIGEIYEAIYSSACGDLFFEQGKYDLARKWHEEGARFFRGTLMTHRHAALSWASFAALEAHDGDHAHARSLIDDARRVAARANNRVVFACVELHGASVDVLGGREGARAKWTKEIARYSDAKDPMGDAVATSFEARFALRMAKRMLERGSIAPPPQKLASLRVDRNGRWFEADGERVELGRRGALRRILVALASARIATPDRGLKQGDLVTAGWPGERVLVDAAATRVRVAIATLRQLGLRSMLLTRDDGYVIATTATVTFVD